MKIRILFAALCLCFVQQVLSQSRIEFNNQEIFLNGSNVAWINFARDIGPGNTNLARFGEIFAELKASGGNSFRLWLHTTGETTPEFSPSTNLVVGPGAGAIEDLKNILDLAWQNEIGLMLCLWSHDMMVLSRTNLLNRNEKLLTDTSAIRAYINNALIPMVEGVKGHPAILAWEIFNEPEGFTEIGAWGDRRLVREFDVQRFVNLTAGAIHRSDSSVQVTSGTWGLQALTNVPTVSKISSQEYYYSLSDEEKEHMEKVFETKYGIHLSAEEIINRFYSTAANTNFYSDNQLIAAGGDPDGILDFYTVHYYSWAGTALSPFHHPYSYWNLDKPLAIAEFFMEDALDIKYYELYQQLYQTGYAGALSWQWWGDTQSNDNAKNNDHTRTLAAMQDIYNSYPNDVVINPVQGTIYSFKSSSDTVNHGESVTLKWITSTGSSVFFEGSQVGIEDSIVVTPDTTTVYSLITNDATAETSYVKIEVLFPGTILSFTASKENDLEKGDSVIFKWETSTNSTVKLNNTPVSEDGSHAVVMDSTTTFYLVTENIVSDTAAITVTVLPSGVVLSFSAYPQVIGYGEESVLVWKTSGGSSVTLNNSPVNEDDSLPVRLNSTSIFTLVSEGQINDTSVVTITVLPPEQVNRALNRMTFSSAGNTPEYITDGDPNTSWNSGNSQTAWINIELGVHHVINKIILKWGNNYASRYRVTDFINFIRYSVIHEETNGSGGEDTVIVNDTVKILRVFLDQSGNQNYSIREIEVYGLPVNITFTEDEPALVEEYQLYQNYPNPFNPNSVISYQLPKAGLVKIMVYDILGNEIKTLLNDYREAGQHYVSFNGSEFASGAYIYQIIAGDFISAKKMLLMK